MKKLLKKLNGSLVKVVLTTLITSYLLWSAATIFQTSTGDRYRGADALRDFKIRDDAINDLRSRIEKLEHD